jgi:Reverse transcriptase (RNA-dependent DNA polymerase)
MCDNKFEKTNFNNYVFVKKYSWGDFIILLLYAEDMLVIESDLKKIKALKMRLESKFAMKDLGAARQILRMRTTRDRKDQNILQRFNMDKCKSIISSLASNFKLSHDGCSKDDKEKEETRNISYASVVGSLMYAMVCMRLVIAHAIGIVSFFF